MIPSLDEKSSFNNFLIGTICPFIEHFVSIVEIILFWSKVFELIYPKYIPNKLLFDILFSYIKKKGLSLILNNIIIIKNDFDIFIFYPFIIF